MSKMSSDSCPWRLTPGGQGRHPTDTPVQVRRWERSARQALMLVCLICYPEGRKHS